MFHKYYFLGNNGDFFSHCFNVTEEIKKSPHLCIKINISETFPKNIKETFHKCLVPTGK